MSCSRKTTTKYNTNLPKYNSVLWLIYRITMHEYDSNMSIIMMAFVWKKPPLNSKITFRLEEDILTKNPLLESILPMQCCTGKVPGSEIEAFFVVLKGTPAAAAAFDFAWALSSTFSCSAAFIPVASSKPSWRSLTRSLNESSATSCTIQMNTVSMIFYDTVQSLWFCSVQYILNKFPMIWCSLDDISTMQYGLDDWNTL